MSCLLDIPFLNLLYIAKGSAGEVRSMLSLATKLNYLEEGESKRLVGKAIEVSRLIMSFIKTIR